jgi:hypothetical protein
MYDNPNNDNNNFNHDTGPHVYEKFSQYTLYSSLNIESRCRLLVLGVKPMNQTWSHNANNRSEYSYDHHHILAHVSRKSLHCSTNISNGSGQGSDALLCVKETHFLELC